MTSATSSGSDDVTDAFVKELHALIDAQHLLRAKTEAASVKIEPKTYPEKPAISVKSENSKQVGDCVTKEAVTSSSDASAKKFVESGSGDTRRAADDEQVSAADATDSVKTEKNCDEKLSEKKEKERIVPLFPEEVVGETDFEEILFSVAKQVVVDGSL